ncbi:MAG TPA: RidA family protein [Nitrospirae bacterium]|nr:RidA family protein [Nitrospirota bacterium]
MQSIIEKRLKELEIDIDFSFSPVGSYIPCLEIDKLIYLSGILPIKDGVLMHKGKIGDDLSIEETIQCTRQIIANGLNILKNHLGNLDEIHRCVKVMGYIAVRDDFYDHPKVMNYCSSLLIDIFGESGRHVRSVIGVSSLPLNSPILIDFIFQRK